MSGRGKKKYSKMSCARAVAGGSDTYRNDATEAGAGVAAVNASDTSVATSVMRPGTVGEEGIAREVPNWFVNWAGQQQEMMSGILTALQSIVKERRSEETPSPAASSSASSGASAVQESGSPAANRQVVSLHANHADTGEAVSISSGPSAISDHSRLLLQLAHRRPSFKGEAAADPYKFLRQLEGWFRRLCITEEEKLVTAEECMLGSAYYWSQIYRGKWRNYADFRADFLKTYWSEQKQLEALREIISARWDPKGNYTMLEHFAYYVSQARLLSTQRAETVLVNDLMRHFPHTLQSLWQMSGRNTIQEAADFLRGQDDLSAQLGTSGGPMRDKRMYRGRENRASFPYPPYGDDEMYQEY